MKKNNKGLTKNYLPVKIFIDDLEEIESILEDSAQNLKIEVGDYEFTKMEEIKSKYNNKKFNDLEISASNPYVSIEFNKMWVRLHCGSGDTRAAGVFYKLDLIISSALRKPKFLYSYYNYWIYGTFAMVLNLILPLIIKGYNWKLIYIITSITGGIWVLLFLYIRLFNYSVIILAKKDDIENFFSRTKDQFIVGIIVGIIVALITIVITTYFPVLQSILHYFFG